ncbi:MAG TPA: hypothetical protein VKB45_00595 [Gemmatimonadales bacterium]|nr:hypothetical protein [Gemmatimonadales bacterium]
MLNRDQVELIQREIDGANSEGDSARARALVAADPEARGLLAELSQVAQLFEQVGERAPPPLLKQAILAALQTPHVEMPQSISRWFAVLLQSTTERLEELVMTKKAILIGATAVAILIVGAYVVTGYPRLGGGAGTIGDSISGVQPAARYHGRALTQGDVTLDNPQIAALFQNQEVLNLVKSDAFREVMKDDAFRTLQQKDAYRVILSTQAFHTVMQSNAYRELMKSDVYIRVMKTDPSREAQSQAWRELQANVAFQALQNNPSFQALQANANFRAMQSNASFQALMASNAFQTIMAKDAMHVLQASQLFRDVAQNAQLSQAFLSEANRVAQ